MIAIGWQVYVGQPKTQAGRRPVALDPLTVEMLRRHLQDSTRTSAPAAAGLVFCGPAGEALHPERVYQAFSRALVRHKLPTIPLHGLRHKGATIALQTGALRVVQERLGRSNIAITLQAYSHVLPTMHDDAAISVAALFMPRAEVLTGCAFGPCDSDAQLILARKVAAQFVGCGLAGKC